MKRKILALTGIRSEYDIIYPVLRAIEKCRSLELRLVVSGTHLSSWHGFTLNKIQKDGFKIADKIKSLFMNDREIRRPKGLGVLTAALSKTVKRERPDLLLVTGDREESIAAALVGNYMNVLVAHIGGGDPAYGNADDPIRFAVSKLAHIHFTTARQYAKNLENIGEERFRIFFSGNPSIDHIRSTRMVDFKKIRRSLKCDIRPDRYIMLIFHPFSSEVDKTYKQMKMVLASIDDFCKRYDLKCVGVYPNTDPGSCDILRAIDEFKDSSRIIFYKNIVHEAFVNLLRKARCLAGNSSMGILEAPFYKLPVVNIGGRQKGRLNAGNVEFVDFNRSSIIKALKKASFNSSYRRRVSKLPNPYGNGTASEKILKVLTSIDIKDKRWYTKRKLC